MTQVTMYGADWCGDCRRSKKVLVIPAELSGGVETIMKAFKAKE